MFQALLTLHDPILLNRKPGQQVLHDEADVTFSCQRGWVGSDCDRCDVNFGPDGECSRCRTGWVGDNCDACAIGWIGSDCDTCATNFGPPGQCDTCNDGWLPPTCDKKCDGFGCCNHGECQGCIQNGRWQGSIGHNSLEVRLTFSGETCSQVVPGEMKD